MQNITQLFQRFSAACTPDGDFFGFFPTWYKYLGGQDVADPNGGSLQCVPQITALTDVWLIVAAVTDMLLRIAVLVAIGFVVAGGIKYMTSQGQPDKTAKALDTIVKAVVGLVLALGSATLLGFVVRSLG